MDNRLPRNEDYTMNLCERKSDTNALHIAHIDASTTDVPIRIVGDILWRDGIWTEIAYADGTREIQNESGVVRYLDATGRVNNYWGHSYPLVRLSRPEAESLRKTNRDGRRCFVNATEQSRKVAAWRYPIVREALMNRPQAAAENHVIGISTLYRWVAAYRAAANAYGDGYVGLLSRPSRVGNRQPRTSQSTEQMIDHYLTTVYLGAEKPTLKYTYELFVVTCEDVGIEKVSYPTFCRRARRMR